MNNEHPQTLQDFITDFTNKNCEPNLIGFVNNAMHAAAIFQSSITTPLPAVGRSAEEVLSAEDMLASHSHYYKWMEVLKVEDYDLMIQLIKGYGEQFHKIPVQKETWVSLRSGVLPKKTEKVLVYGRYASDCPMRVFEALFSVKEKRFRTDIWCKGVTHWMPIPDVPSSQFKAVSAPDKEGGIVGVWRNAIVPPNYKWEGYTKVHSTRLKSIIKRISIWNYTKWIIKDGEAGETVIKYLDESTLPQSASLQDAGDETAKIFKKEPVNFLLVNALRNLSEDQLTQLRDSLSDRLPEKDSSKWISVEIELPTGGTNVIAGKHNGLVCEMRYFDYKFQYRQGNGKWLDQTSQVTHYQLLPSPPKSVESNK